MGVTTSQATCIPCGSGAADMVGCLSINETEETRHSRGIDKNLRETRRNLANTPKILLLGGGDSGKSTIIKQMRIINNVPFTEHERELYRVQVFYNLVNGMKALLEALRDLPPLEGSSDAIQSPNAGVGNTTSNAPVTGTAIDPTTGTGNVGRSSSSSGGLRASSAGSRVLPRVGSGKPLTVTTGSTDSINEPTGNDGDDVTHAGGTTNYSHSPTLNTTVSRPREDSAFSNDDGRPVSSVYNPELSISRPLSSIGHTDLRDTSLAYKPDGSDRVQSPAFRTHSRSGLREPSTSSAIAGTSRDAEMTSPRHQHSPSNLSNRQPSQPTPAPADRTPPLKHAKSADSDTSPSRSLTRSPSISLNLFNPGSLTPRQVSLLNELSYAPDLRPGQPFPLQFESMLRECWWGYDPQDDPDGEAGEKTEGVGNQVDRVGRESGAALPDNLSYFFSSPRKLASFFEVDYVPSDDDILRCRSRSTGIQETIFTLGRKGLGGALVANSANSAGATLDESSRGKLSGNATVSTLATSGTNAGASGSVSGWGEQRTQYPPLRISMGKTKLHMVDVGGQRSERRKWIHCFQDVTAVLFLVGLSGYHQGLVEDNTVNQMQDAMSLWDGVCSSQWFKNTSLILFLNKTDLFAEKVGKFPVRNYFPDFDPPSAKDDLEALNKAGMDYFRRRFLRVAAKSAARSRKLSTVHAGQEKHSKTPDDKGKGKAREYNSTPTSSGMTHHINSMATSSSHKEGERRDGFSSRADSDRKDTFHRKEPDSTGKSKGKSKETMNMRERTVYTHFTNATDTSQLRMVILAVCDIILRDNFAHANLI